ncbi:ATP-dependent Clp protease proteolytic subunit [Gracilaria domingensis]|nr:ATP-dependent Clp protease proteolytic subunit [Gracilaria domingensis]
MSVLEGGGATTLAFQQATRLAPQSTLVPTVLEQTPRGERVFDIYPRFLMEHICVNEPINDSMVVAQLLVLESGHPSRTISMCTNSPGGIVAAGLAIYHTIQCVAPDIATLCVGQPCSMASLLHAAGTAGNRRALLHARIMIHQPSGGAQGQASDIGIHATEILNLRKRLKGIYVAHVQDLLRKLRPRWRETISCLQKKPTTTA